MCYWNNLIETSIWLNLQEFPYMYLIASAKKSASTTYFNETGGNVCFESWRSNKGKKISRFLSIYSLKKTQIKTL